MVISDCEKYVYVNICTDFELGHFLGHVEHEAVQWLLYIADYNLVG